MANLGDRHKLIERPYLVGELRRLDLTPARGENRVGRGELDGLVYSLAQYVNLGLDGVEVVAHRSGIAALQGLLDEQHDNRGYVKIYGFRISFQYLAVCELPPLFVDQVIIDRVFDLRPALLFQGLFQIRIVADLLLEPDEGILLPDYQNPGELLLIVELGLIVEKLPRGHFLYLMIFLVHPESSELKDICILQALLGFDVDSLHLEVFIEEY